MKQSKRKHLRTKTAIKVWLGNEGVYQRKDESILTIGVGGAFIRTMVPAPTGSLLTLRFRLNDNDDYVTCRAAVRYTRPGAGMGVEFADLTKDDRQRIKLFVENQLLSEVLHKTAVRVTGKLPGKDATLPHPSLSNSETVYRAA